MNNKIVNINKEYALKCIGESLESFCKAIRDNNQEIIELNDEILYL